MSNYLVTTSGQKMIQAALRKLGVLGVGINLSAEDQATGLEALNGMLDSWNTLSLVVPGRNEVDKVLTGGKQTYTIGEGADIDISRPVTLEEGTIFLRMNGIDYPLQVLTFEEWAEIPLKTIGTRPRKLYYDNNLNASGWGNISLFPIPDQDYTLILWLDQQIKQIANALTQFQMQPGYVRAITYNLAIELAPEYGKEPSAAVAAIAAESLGNIKRVNSVPRYLSVDPALLWTSRAINDLAFGGGGAAGMPVPDFLTTAVSQNLPSTSRWLVVEANAGVGGISLALPNPAANKSMLVTIDKIDNNAGIVTITGTGNLLPYQLVNQYQTVTFISDGQSWIVQANN